MKMFKIAKVIAVPLLIIILVGMFFGGIAIGQESDPSPGGSISGTVTNDSGAPPDSFKHNI